LKTYQRLRLSRALATDACEWRAVVRGLSLAVLAPTMGLAQLNAPPALPASGVNAPSEPTAGLPPVIAAPNREGSGLMTPPPGLPPIVAADAIPISSLRDQASNLAAQAKLALTRGDLTQARNLLDKANGLRVPDAAYAQGQLRPWQVALELDRAERLRGTTAGQVAPGGADSLPSSLAAVPTGPLPTATNAVTPASQVVPVTGTTGGPEAGQGVSTGIFQPDQDGTLVQAAAAQDIPKPPATPSQGETLFRDGVAALAGNDRDRAMKLFTEAWKFERDLDPLTRAQLKDKLTLMQSNQAAKNQVAEPVNAIQQLSQEQNLARQKMWREVTTEIAEAERMVDNDPHAALDRLQMLRQRVSQSSVDGAIRKSHLAMVDRVITNIQAYIEQNKPAIDQQERNKVIEDRLVMEAATKAKIDAEVQSMVDQYNDLFQKGMYAEAEIIAKKVGQLSPNTEISTVLLSKATLARRNQEYEDIQAAKAENGAIAFTNVDSSSIPFDDNRPYMHGDVKAWTELTKRRKGSEDYRMTPAEKAIRERLVEPVDISFDGRPLAQAMQTLSEMTGIPIFVDPNGLSTEGLTSDTRISLNLNGQSVSMKSALNLMLDHLNLTYVIKDEVLKITSKETANRQREIRTYNVRDLVIPIPNFVTDYNSGLAGALQSAYQATNSSLLVKTQDMSVSQIGSQRLAGMGPEAAVDPNSAALGQFGGGMPGMPGMPGMMRGNNPPVMGSSSPFLSGNGGNGLGGGGSLANFTELINLIQTTVNSNWEADGGEDTIREFPSNLSLIVSAPLETHEAIGDLLRQLRSLQNLQVTIEVKFITLSDNFFEQMGVDFDFNVADKKLVDGDGLLRRNEGSSTVGLSGPTSTDPTLSPTLDLQFRQGNFSASAPPFGAINAGGAAQLGFAILSDLELFFFLQATQGDRRTNILQAPKVTMFDGQFASVNDFAQRPFVISLQPVVGDFAVAQQPIIVVLNDGTTLNVQSVVSQDKRYVRLTLNPSFTRIEDADRTFTFTGRKTSKSGSTVIGPDGKPTNDRDDEEEVTEGSTVQLPTLGITSVQTTVNVPDGGTILLGGIKRLREGRTEEGVPILSKIPYINRLFKNVGIGRETNTLMMTVTPRIIIPEEEEANVIGTVQP
jgi:general secretion pathway protein D